MSSEFGRNGYELTPADIPSSDLLHALRILHMRLYERKPAEVGVNIINHTFFEAYLDRTVCRRPDQTVSYGTLSWSLGIIIHNPLQLRIDFDPTREEMENVPAETQELCLDLGYHPLDPVRTSIVLPFSIKGNDHFGIVLAPGKLSEGKMGAILTSDPRCEPGVIGNGTGKDKRELLTKKLTEMRQMDSFDHRYSALMNSTAMWARQVLLERLNYC